MLKGAVRALRVGYRTSNAACCLISSMRCTHASSQPVPAAHSRVSAIWQSSHLCRCRRSSSQPSTCRDGALLVTSTSSSMAASPSCSTAAAASPLGPASASFSACSARSGTRHNSSAVSAAFGVISRCSWQPEARGHGAFTRKQVASATWSPVKEAPTPLMTLQSEWNHPDWG